MAGYALNAAYFGSERKQTTLEANGEKKTYTRPVIGSFLRPICPLQAGGSAGEPPTLHNPALRRGELPRPRIVAWWRRSDRPCSLPLNAAGRLVTRRASHQGQALTPQEIDSGGLEGLAPRGEKWPGLMARTGAH